MLQQVIWCLLVLASVLFQVFINLPNPAVSICKRANNAQKVPNNAFLMLFLKKGYSMPINAGIRCDTLFHTLRRENILHDLNNYYWYQKTFGHRNRDCARRCLTRWVPHVGYIRHQNDHLSGRMTDISVMGEWQVAGVGGTRPLWNVLGEAIEGRFSFEARNYLFSFQSYVRFEEFFVSRAFERFGAKGSSSGAFGFDDVLGLLKTPLRHPAFFCELWLRPQVFLENFLSFFQSRAGFTCLTAMAIPSLSKALWWLYVEN